MMALKIYFIGVEGIIMEKIRIALAGLGAFGQKHLDGLMLIKEAEVTAVIGTRPERNREIADKYHVPNTFVNLDDALASKDVDAVILCTPTQLHVKQGIACLKAGKHVQIEIPICDSLAEGEELLEVQEKTGLVAMGGHTRRFNPSHQFIHKAILKGEINVLQMDVQTYFFRRTNMNALGQPRSWTDSLLWHHSAHTIDLFAYQTRSKVIRANAVQGPVHPELKIPMDMSIQLKAENGAICTLSLSFNNDGPLGTYFRYICDNNTYIANYDDLSNGKGEAVDLSHVAVSMNGIELQDREFVSAILENRDTCSSIHSVFPCYEVIDKLEKQLV